MSTSTHNGTATPVDALKRRNRRGTKMPIGRSSPSGELQRRKSLNEKHISSKLELLFGVYPNSSPFSETQASVSGLLCPVSPSELGRVRTPRLCILIYFYSLMWHSHTQTPSRTNLMLFSFQGPLQSPSLQKECHFLNQLPLLNRHRRQWKAATQLQMTCLKSLDLKYPLSDLLLIW